MPGRIQDRMVLEILSLPEETDRLALVQLFKNLGMGDGKQKRFFNLIRDIALREGSSISAYLQKKEITAILDHQEMNIPQKIQHLGSLLQHEFTPSIFTGRRGLCKKGQEFAASGKLLNFPLTFLRKRRNHPVNHF